VQSGIRPDTGYQKRPDYAAGYPASRISGASLDIKHGFCVAKYI
jgi:hypothetical protein